MPKWADSPSSDARGGERSAPVYSRGRADMSPSQIPPIPKGERETDAHRLSQRLKQLEKGYNTLGYERYLRALPKQKRSREDPKTPDRFKLMSKRAWDGLIRKWRRRLHDWDPPTADGGASKADSTGPTGPAMEDDGLVACAPPDDDEDEDDIVAMTPEDQPIQSAAADKLDASRAVTKAAVGANVGAEEDEATADCFGDFDTAY